MSDKPTVTCVDCGAVVDVWRDYGIGHDGLPFVVCLPCDAQVEAEQAAYERMNLDELNSDT